MFLSVFCIGLEIQSHVSNYPTYFPAHICPLVHINHTYKLVPFFFFFLAVQLTLINKYLFNSTELKLSKHTFLNLSWF